MTDDGGDSNEKVQNILGSLNEAQRKAVTEPLESRLQILAGPGTGKTKTLTSRVAYLLYRGVKPENMVVMTFTNKAVKDMKDRISYITGDDALVKKLKIGTYHSICVRYIKMFGGQIGIPNDFTIVDTNDKVSVIEDVVFNMVEFINEMNSIGWIKTDTGTFVSNPDADQEFDEYERVVGFPTKNEIAQKISTQKNKGITVARFLRDYGPSAISLCYKYYQEYLDKNAMLDFDDLLLKCMDLLKACPWVVKNVDAVLVDEFQDSNGIQLELTRLFSQEKRNVTVVGDPDQSIYLFRNAQPENLRYFQESYPDTKVIYLEENYRSCQPVLDHALALINEDPGRLGADRRLLGNTNAVYCKPVFGSLGLEVDEVVDQIEHLCHSQYGKQVFRYGDIAILAKTKRARDSVIGRLVESGIPYTIAGGLFWERKEIKTLIDYLKVIHNGNDKSAIARTMNVPSRGFGKEFITKVLPTFPDDEDLLDQLEKVARDPYGSFAKSVNLGRTNKSMGTLLEYVLLVKHCRQVIQQTPTFDNAAFVVGMLNDQLKLHEVFGTNPGNKSSRLENIKHLASHIRAMGLDYGHNFNENDAISEEEESLENCNVEVEERSLKKEEVKQKANVEAKVESSQCIVKAEAVEHIDLTLDNDDVSDVDGPHPIGEFLRSISTSNENDPSGNRVETSKNSVTLSTIHAAKGLEWPIVFVIDCVEGALYFAKTPQQVSEVRRLFYVAGTRSKILTYYTHSIGRPPLHMLRDSRVSCHSNEVNTTLPHFTKAQFAAYAKFLGRKGTSDKRKKSGVHRAPVATRRRRN